MRKILAAIGLCLLFCSSIQAKDNTNAKVIKTKYFDVIYKGVSEQSALIISQKIDSLYLEIRNKLCVENDYYFKNFPVILISSRDSLNAYFTKTPYNAILLYDTVPQENLAVYSENLVKVLYHEMTHAVTLNIKDKFNQVLSEVFADCMGWDCYTAPSSIIEGAAVALESDDGEGRLNDVYSTQIIMQAKIEGVFPEWNEITGSRDIYPKGELPYIFGGAFTQYLQKTYGLELYGQFWYALVNKLINYPTTFKRIYGITIDKAWNDFYESIEVPDLTVKQVPKDTFQDEFLLDYQETKSASKKGFYDFFDYLEEPSKKANTNRLVSSTSWIKGRKEGGVAWIENPSESVWYTQKIDGKLLSKGEKLFTLSGIQRISFSPDGKYLAVSRFVDSTSTKARAGLYKVETKKFFFIDESGYRDSCLFYAPDKTLYLAAVKTESQNCQIHFFKVIDNGKISFEKTNYKIDLPYGTVAFSLTPTGDGRLAYVFKEKLNWSIRLFDLSTNSEVEYKTFSEGVVIRNLSGIIADNFYTGQKGCLLAFSWAKKGTLPRLGYLAIRKDLYSDFSVKYSGNWYLQNSDVSGGVHSPAAFPLSESHKLASVVYTSKKYSHYDLNVLHGDEVPFVKQEALESVPSSVTEKLTANSNDSLQSNIPVNTEENSTSSISDFEIKNYIPLSYYFRGVFIPISLFPEYSIDFSTRSAGIVGATWISSTPDTNNLLVLSSGYDPLTQTFGAYGNLSGGTKTSFFTYNLEGTAVLDANGFRQTVSSLELLSKIPVFTHSTVQLKNTTKFLYGYETEKLGKNLFKIQDRNSIYRRINNQFSVLIDTLHTTGSSYYDEADFYIGPFMNFGNIENLSSKISNSYMSLGLQTGFTLPYWQSMSFDLAIFPSYQKMAEFEASVILFSTEIQKGTKHFILPLYANRFTCTLGYSGAFEYEKNRYWAICQIPEIFKELSGTKYYDTVYLSSDFYFNINTGSLAGNYLLDLSAQVLYDIRSSDSGSHWSLKLCSILVF